MSKKLFFALLILLIACSEKPRMIPQSLGKLKLDKYLSGRTAKEMINKMHTSAQVAGDENEIGFYSVDTLKAILYISKFKSAQTAQQKLEQMLIKIAHGGTPFVLHDQVSVGGRPIFLLFGMGQSHYIYADGDRLIWLSVDFPISLETLHSLLRQLKQKS